MLDVAGFWRDEVFSLTVAQRSWHSILFERFGEGRNQPPLHTLLIHATLASQPALGFLSTEAAARLPFALAGALTCALLALTAFPFGRAAGLLGAALLACSYGHLAQSVEARPYALLTLWALATFLAVDRAVRVSRGAGRWWAVAAGTGLAGILSSYLMVYAVLPGIGLYAAWRLWPQLRQALGGPEQVRARRTLRAPLLAGALLAAGMARAVPELLSLSLGGLGGANAPDALVKLLLYNGLTFGPSPAAPWALALAGLVVLGTWAGLRTAGDVRRATVGILLTLGCGLVTVAVSGPSDLVAPRYWSYSYPFLCWLAGAGLVAGLAQVRGHVAGRGVGRWTRAAAPVLVVLLAFSGAPGVMARLAAQDAPPGLSDRPDFRAAARTLATLAQPGDLIAILSATEHGWRVCDWYWGTAAPLRPGVQVTSTAGATLGDLRPAGAIYWLLAADAPSDLDAVAGAPPLGMQIVSQGARVLIFRERPAGGHVPATAVAELAGALMSRAVSPAFQHALAVAQASAAQAQGAFADAARGDRAAGTDRPLGREHLANAAGYLGLGEQTRALIDIAAARALEPASADVHRRAAGLLAAAGRPAAAAREQALAALLR